MAGTVERLRMPARDCRQGRRGRDGPINLADEIGYLANARVMSGGVAGELSHANVYRGGYSLLLLLPAYWLGDGPRAQYHLVLATNALLSSLVFLLLVVLLTRVFAVPPRTACAAAFLAALVGLFLRPPVDPDHLVYGRYIEILVPPPLALGLVRLWTSRTRPLLMELTVGTAAALAACPIIATCAGGLVARGRVNWLPVLALPALAQARGHIRLVSATLVA
jgi:hypothetical protein